MRKLDSLPGTTPSDAVAEGVAEAAVSSSEDQWTCGICTLLNPAVATVCSACGSAPGEEGSAAAAAAALPQVASASWTCSQCTLTNPKSSTHCAACSAQAPSPVTSATLGQGDTAPKRTVRASMKRVVFPADNNCLFTSIAYLLQGGCDDKGASLRQVVAQAVAADPVKWNESVLGKPPAEYVSWIKRPNQAWGGAIELAIFAEHFGTTIVALDVQTVKEHVFQPGSKEATRVAFLLYDGIHYDAAAMDPVGDGTPRLLLERTFGSADATAWETARALVREAHAKRQFTDTASFTLRCLVCQKGLVGQQAAMKHAKESGHANFAEY